jgi:hypothetical protein
MELSTDYIAIDEKTQLVSVENRIRELERQRLDIELRVAAPGVGEYSNSTDHENLARLDESLKILHDRRDSLKPATQGASS